MVAESYGSAERWSSIVANAGLDLPIRPGEKHRLLRRLALKLCWPFVSRQIQFNHDLLAELVEVRDSLVQQIDSARSDAYQGLAVAQQHIAERLLTVKGRLDQLSETLEKQGWAVDAILPTLEKHGYAVDAILPTLEKHGYAIDSISEKVEDFVVDRDLVHQELELAQQQSFSRMHEGVGMLRTEIADLGRHILEARAQIEEEARAREQLQQLLDERMDDQDRSRDEVLHHADDGLADLRWRFAQLDLLLDSVRRSLPEVPEPEDLAALPRPIENLYCSLEEVMRGPHDVIVERVRPYLEDVQLVTSDAPVLDVGCGRGEWLEVLGGAGIAAYGIEVTSIYEDHWARNALDVRIEDVREHLAKIDEGSLRAVTALHVVEHLTTDEVIEFLGLALRALVPGGLLLLETPSPENLLVGSWSFYLDPTHRKPIPARLLSFYVGSRGYKRVETRYLPRPELPLLELPASGKPWKHDLEPLIDLINRHLLAPQDYAVLAHRA